MELKVGGLHIVRPADLGLNGHLIGERSGVRLISQPGIE
jgi:hypothetical protein